MKPGTLFLLAAAAVAALLTAWMLLDTNSGPVHPGDPSVAASERGVVTLGPDEELRDVEARPESVVQVDGRPRGMSRVRASKTEEELARPLAATGPYTGRLVDPLGRPMPDIAVLVKSWEGATRPVGGMQFGMGRKRKPQPSTTDDEGRFAFTSKKPLGRSLGVITTVPGYSVDPIHCLLDPEKGRALGDVVLQPAVIVSGWVRDADDHPVAGAQVRRVQRNGEAGQEMLEQIGFGALIESVTTDADGRFEMPHEKEGLITLMVASDEILPKRWDGPTKRGGDVLQDIVIRVERAGKIDGFITGYPEGRRRGLVAAIPMDTVENAESGGGLSELLAAQFSPAGDHTAPVAADGSFTLPGLVPGAKYRLRAISKSFFVRTAEISNAVEARAGGAPVSLDFRPGASVTFQAIDAKTRKPVEVMSISGRFGSEPAYLQLSETAGDPPDRFPGGKVTAYEMRLRNAPRTLTITVDAPGYFRKSGVEVDVPESGTVNFGKVELHAAPLLKFRVVDAATNKPIRRARITIEPTAPPLMPGQRREEPSGEEDGPALTDEEKEEQEAAEAFLFGEYRVRSRGRTDRQGRRDLTMIEGDHVTLEVRARGYATYVVAPFHVPTGFDEDQEIEIRMAGGGSLQAIVTDTEGNAAPSVRVECRRKSGERMIKKGVEADDNGIAEFENIAAGTWEVRAFRRDRSIFAEGGRGQASHPTVWEEVRTTRGATAHVELQVPAVGDLSGVVLLGNDPSADARVSLASPDKVDRAERLMEFQDQFAGLSPDTTTGVTDFEGSFVLTDVIPGEYVLLTRHPDLAMVVRTEVEVAVGSNSITVKIPATVLEGRVVDDSGSPVVGAAVTVERHTEDADAGALSIARQFLNSNQRTTATTDVDGHYRLLGVMNDVELTVAVEAAGYADNRLGPVTARKDEAVSVPLITLERAGSILVTCDVEALGAQFGFVRAKPVDGHAVEQGAVDKFSLLRGDSAQLKGLVHGTWEITVEAQIAEGESRVLGPERVKVKPGEQAELTL